MVGLMVEGCVAIVEVLGLAVVCACVAIVEVLGVAVVCAEETSA